ncbi:hypothetical protein GCM10027181_02070 [Rheinheimera gaetbuli]
MLYRLCMLLGGIAAIYPLQACPLAAPEPVPTQLASSLLGAQPRQVNIYNNLSLSELTATGTLALYSANNLQLLDRLQQWPVASGHIGAILAQPVVLDSNYDGIADAIYAVDVAGLVWFVGLKGSGFMAPELIADFSTQGYQFDRPLQLVQTQAVGADGQFQYQSTLFLTASDGLQHSIVIALKHSAQRSGVVELANLVDRSSISADEARYGIDEQQWSELQHAAGWYIGLARQIISKPQVYAGVVYLLSAKPGSLAADCALAADAAPQLHAVHLHHAGLVYARREQQVQLQSNGVLALEQEENGDLQLVLKQGQSKQVLKTALQAISAECADCTEPLTATQFPQFIRLATFQTEYGAH